MTSNVATIPRARRTPAVLDERVARFLTSALEPGHHVERVELRQITVAGDSRIDRWRVTRDTNVAELAELVFARAVDDAEAHRGLVSYGVVAVEADGELGGRQLFKVPGGGAGNGSIGESEPPNDQGVISMLQRHAETATKMGYAAMSSALDHYRRAVDGKDAHAEALEKNSLKVFQMLGELTGHAHEREVEMARQKSSDARMDQVAEKAIGLMPVIAAKVFGGAGGGGAFLGGELLKQLLGTMTQEQLAAIAGMLRPEQMVTFSELYNVTAAAAGPSAAAPPETPASSPTTPTTPASSAPLEGEVAP